MSLVLSLWLALAAHRSPRGDPVEAWSPRPSGPLVWLHAGAGTEPAAILELVRRLHDQRPEVTVLLSQDGAGPVERPGADRAGRARKGRGLIDVAPPPDATRAVAGFLAHWAPDLAIRTGLALVPATMAGLARARVPLVMIDLHLPIGGARMVWRVPRLARALLRPVHRLLAADEATAQVLRRHGARPERVEVLGHLPDATGAVPCVEAERTSLARAMGGRPVWLALAPSPPELPLVLAAHRQAMRRAHRLLLILAVTSDPEAAAAEAEAAGFTVARRWSDGEPVPETEVLVADGIAERGLWYRLAPVTFVGQTIEAPPPADGAEVPRALSPYEPAALGSAILHGPQTGGYASAFGKLMRAGATLPVRSSAELAQAVDLLQSPDRTAALAHAAWDVASAGAEVADRVIDLIVAALDAREVAG